MQTFEQNPYPPAKPGLLTTVGVLTLANGIFNIGYGITLTSAVVFGTLFFGIVCAPLTLLPCVLGLFEIIYALKLLKNPLARGTRPSHSLAIWQIVALISGNMFSPVVGVLALVFYNDNAVARYFASINN